MTALGAVLMEYPLWAGERVVKQGGSDNPEFPPSAASLRKHLEEQVRSLRFAQQWDARTHLQHEETKQIEADRERRKTYEQIKNDLAKAGMFIGRDRNGGEVRDESHGETAESVRKKFNLSEEQWDSIPNAPPRDQWKRLVDNHGT